MHSMYKAMKCDVWALLDIRDGNKHCDSESVSDVGEHILQK